MPIPKANKIFVTVKIFFETCYVLSLKTFVDNFINLTKLWDKNKGDNIFTKSYTTLLIIISLFIYVVISVFGLIGTFNFFNDLSFDKTINTKDEIHKFFQNRTELIKEGECLEVAKMEKLYIEASLDEQSNWIETCTNTLNNRIYSYDLVIQKISDIENYKRAKVSLFEIEDKPDNGVVKTYYWQRTFYLNKELKEWKITKTTKNLISTKESLFD